MTTHPGLVHVWDVVWVANAIPYFPMQFVTVLRVANAIPYFPMQLVTVLWAACAIPCPVQPQSCLRCARLPLESFLLTMHELLKLLVTVYKLQII